MSLEALAHDDDGFRATPKHDGDALRLVLEGEVGLDGVEAVGKILVAVHSEAQRLKTKEVILDLSQLEFLNSSGVKHFVTWVRNASALPEPTAYRIRLVSNPLMPWQRRSLEALRCFNAALVSVETVQAS